MHAGQFIIGAAFIVLHKTLFRTKLTHTAKHFNVSRSFYCFAERRLEQNA